MKRITLRSSASARTENVAAREVEQRAHHPGCFIQVRRIIEDLYSVDAWVEDTRTPGERFADWARKLFR